MLQSVKLTNFRTHKNTQFDFVKPLSFIVGQNAAGKTNLIEAIYMNALSRSFRSTVIDLVSLEKDFFKISTTHQVDNKLFTVETRFKTSVSARGTKTITINQVKKPAKSIIGLFPVVLFEPSDLDIITAGPQKRRQFLDILLSQADPYYIDNLQKFKRVIRQRNQLLRQIQQGRASGDDLFVYNLQIVEPAHYITTARSEFLQSITKPLSKFYQQISKTNHLVDVAYNPSLPKEKKYILREIERAHERDILLGYSTRGPHRDHIDILLHKNVPVDGLSRGEIRTLTLALKLAEIEYLAKQNTNPPLLLLDDVFSELDPERQTHLWDAAQKYQTITTTTHIEDPGILPDHQVIQL